MKVIISPSKTMQEVTYNHRVITLPRNENETKEILKYLQGLTGEEIKQLMKINDRLANLTKERFDNLSLDVNGNPAIFSYDGLQYRNIDLPSMQEEELEFMNEHIRIISGFYGILSPFSSVYPYRLEMQTKLHLNECMNLYEFWNSKLYETLKEESTVIINLASLEYSKAIKPYVSEGVEFITCIFKVKKEDKLKVESTASKIARGQMVNYIVKQRINNAEQIKNFNVDGYEFMEELSTQEEYIFVK